MTSQTPSLAARLWLALTCWIRLVFDNAFAEQVLRLRREKRDQELPVGSHTLEQPVDSQRAVQVDARGWEDANLPALQLLAALQREGRFIDFLQQDIESFDDAEIGAAARVVHEGCRRAIRRHVQIEPVCDGQEGASMTLEAGFDAQAFKLTGNVSGSAPHRGTLRHRGWRAAGVTLPEVVDGHDARLIAAAEVEL